ncbi:MAG: DMT family transporter [Devosia sp.]
MPIGVLLAVLSYSIYSIGDSIIKGFGTGTLSAFELNFIISLFSLSALPFARATGDRWRDVFEMRRPVLMHLRAMLFTGAQLFFTIAVTRIPFAETYSLAFLAPLFLTLLSVLLLKESVSITRWLLVAASFVGVLIVVRPGFQQLGIGHLSIIACAFCAATSNAVLRIMSSSKSGSEKQLSILAIGSAYQLVVTGVLMVIAGFVMPAPFELLRLAFVGLLAGAAQLLAVRALQLSPASHIGPTHYVQMLWVVVLGALFYQETQDAIGYGGLALIVVAGIATVFSDGAQARISGRWIEYRARRGEAAITPSEGPEV